MKRNYLAAMLVMCALSVMAEEKQFNSPDGKVAVTVNDNGGRPTYQVSYEGQPFLLPSQGSP